MEGRPYETLNGLRGLAALVVALGHAPEPASRYVPSSYLAVDLFFILSGFVLAHSYDARLPVIGARVRHRAMLRPYWRPAPVMLLLILPLVLTAPLPAGGARVAYDLFVVVVGAPGLVLLAAAREPGPALTRLCQALGVMSYGLYALHVPTYELLRRMGLALSAWQVAATLAALAAAVLWLDRVYDQPIRARLAPLYRASATPRRADAIPVA